jgi:hypothetical protein
VNKDKRLPLNRASDAVLEELRQLREQVNDLCGNNTDKNREFLQCLLRMIDDVCDLRFSSSEGPSQGEHAEQQGPKTSVSVDAASSSGGSRGISNRINFASRSTAVTRGLFSGTQTSEGEDGFESASFISF